MRWTNWDGSWVAPKILTLRTHPTQKGIMIKLLVT